MVPVCKQVVLGLIRHRRQVDKSKSSAADQMWVNMIAMDSRECFNATMLAELNLDNTDK